MEYPTKCKLLFLKSTIFLLFLSKIYASFTFHSGGTFQSKTLVPDRILHIFYLGNSFLMTFKVFLTPSPVKLLDIGKRECFAN